MTDDEEIRKAVRGRYAMHVQASCCDQTTSATGCGAAAPLKLGVGRPVKDAKLRAGETVVDLGSGTGVDAIEASKAVGKDGLVIGVDSTPEMILESRKNARERNLRNVEFRLGEIEHLPVESSSADVIISDCVINLSPDKPQVFREAFRILKPGGRIVVSDVVVEKKLPDAVRRDPDAWAGCVAGAVRESDYHKLLKEAGFEGIETMHREKAWMDALNSALISAKKPVGRKR